MGVLTDCHVRFSQRQVFEDEFEFTPKVEHFGTGEEILQFAKADPMLRRHPEWLMELAAQDILSSPEKERAQMDQVRRFMTAPDEYAAFCLTEDPRSERMWLDYAGNSRGFVVAFDTGHPAFVLLRRPGLLGKVEYTDAAVSSFLSAYGTDTFFRKRIRYNFEREWRSLRAISRIRRVVQNDGKLPLYLAPFDPACISELLIRRQCSIEWELRSLVAIDFRYRQVPVTLVN
jgi:hypothetical protein